MAASMIFHWLLAASLISSVCAADPVSDARAAYETGRYPEAVRLAQAPANAGNAQAQVLMGLMYQHGRGVPADPRKAAEWYQKAAAQGDAAAQNNLGFLYERGAGVPQDFRQAKDWYERAARQGYPFAERNLAVLYETGRGVPHDPAEAFRWYRDAAEQGSRFAQYKLGELFERGSGAPRDLVEAYKWYSLAAAQGYSDSNFARLKLTLQMVREQVAEGARRATEFAPVEQPGLDAPPEPQVPVPNHETEAGR